MILGGIRCDYNSDLHSLMTTPLDESEPQSIATANRNGSHRVMNSDVSESDLRVTADYCMQAYIVLGDAARSFGEPHGSALSSAHAAAKTCFDRLSTAADQYGIDSSSEYDLAPARRCAVEAREAVETITKDAGEPEPNIQSVFFALRTLTRVEQRIRDLAYRSSSLSEE